MKKYSTVLLFFILSANFSFAQFGGRFGFTAGVTNFSTKTEILFSKSMPGFSLGMVGTSEIADNLDLLVEFNYSQHYLKLVGRETPESTPEDIKFKMGNYNMPVIFNYNVLNLKNDLQFGLQLGASASLMHEMKLNDSGKEDYYLDPYYLKPSDLEFDSTNGQLSFNAFAVMGVSATYERFMVNFRYFKGITDPYRHAPFYFQADGIDIKGKDNYYNFTLIYFINEGGGW
ncbi:PorT family protein [Flavobacterium azooxidireducens]|uniref:PorT family protein n=1 Tax=Flavobacterium azooxidireducens TaxID=1871076 RepID=A0ABY4KD26_9FLAO|nr:outer membrane beta-barrel protein [Flavobacterium azooxidireducens]UPQ78619.1 PorT family protein [Flavobacterium azooxidireducens]